MAKTGLQVPLSPVVLPPHLPQPPCAPSTVLYARSLGIGPQFCSVFVQHLRAQAIPQAELRGTTSTALEIIKYRKHSVVSVKKSNHT